MDFVVGEATRTLATTSGLAIAVVSGGEVIFAQGMGTTRMGGNTPVTSSTLFNTGSVSKMFAGLVVASQITEGSLSLSSSVRSFVPEMNSTTSDPAAVLVEHLVEHSSGLGDWTDTDYVFANELSGEFAANAEDLWTPSGAVFNYSNRGYSLLGLVSERVDGQPYADVLVDRVFGPMGFPDGTATPAVASSRAHAIGHAIDYGTTSPSDLTPSSGPATGVWLSADDLGVLLNGLLGHNTGLGVDAQVEWTRPLMETRASPGQHYGYGLYHEEGLTHRELHHSGSFPGFVADVVVYPDLDLGWALLANDDDAALYELSEALRLAIVGDNPAVSVSLPPRVAPASIAGTYITTTELGTLTVAGGPETLNVTSANGDFELVEYEEGAYYGEHPVVGFLAVTLWPDAQGDAQYLVSRAGVGIQAPSL